MKRVFLLAFLAALFIFASPETNAQQTANAVRAEPVGAAFGVGSINSKLMARRMPYQILLPKNYEIEKQARFPVLYLLHGLSGNYKNWFEKTKIQDYAAQHRIIIITPEGGDGWYSDSATAPNDKYESYIIQELVPEIDKTFRTVAEKRGRAIAGLSMGGFGALKFGVKYPESFALAASMSGYMMAASYQTMDELPRNEWLRKPILAAFGDPSSQTRKENDLFKLLSEMPPEKVSGLPFLYLDCGTEDGLGLVPSNQQLAQILLTRKIPHEYRQLPGKHGWDYWNQQVREILRLSEKVFASPAKQ